MRRKFHVTFPAVIYVRVYVSLSPNESEQRKEEMKDETKKKSVIYLCVVYPHFAYMEPKVSPMPIQTQTQHCGTNSSAPYLYTENI